MKNNILLMLMFTVVMIWSFIPQQAYSAEKSSSAKKATTGRQAPVISKTKGKVISCNLKNSTVLISADTGASLVIAVDKNTALTKGGKNIKLADIKAGDAVTVSYETKKGVNTAKSISVQGKTASSAPVSAKSKK